MRINQYLASCKLGSRRKVEELVKNGSITINDMPATLTSQVTTDDVVKYNGKQLRVDNEHVYYVLNKPIGYLCTVSDDRGRPTILDIIKDKEHRIFPVGRLDYNTEGLIIVTNDGDFANKIIHPSSMIGKTYEFTTKVRPSLHQLKQLRQGVMLEDGKTSKAIVGDAQCVEDVFKVEITIFEGRNRQVRRMCEAVGLKIVKLRRIAIGGLTLGNLPLKKYKKVSKEQLQIIFE